MPYCFLGSSIKFQGHKGWKIDDLNPIWVRLIGRSQLSNHSDLPCYIGNTSDTHLKVSQNLVLPSPLCKLSHCFESGTAHDSITAVFCAKFTKQGFHNREKVIGKRGFARIEFDSSPPSAAYIRTWNRLALVQIMACHLKGTQPLSEPMLEYC